MFCTIIWLSIYMFMYSESSLHTITMLKSVPFQKSGKMTFACLNSAIHFIHIRAIPEKNTWGGGGGGRRQAIYFSMGGRCAHFSNYMGPWCLTNSDYIGGGVRPIISNSVGGCIAFAASRRGKNIICKSVDKCCHKKA